MKATRPFTPAEAEAFYAEMDPVMTALQKYPAKKSIKGDRGYDALMATFYDIRAKHSAVTANNTVERLV